MKKNTFFIMPLAFATALMFVGCATKYDISAPGENLTTLTKVHETEYRCDYPYGGDKEKNLYFVTHDNKNYSNISRKESPTSLSVVQITAGKNSNTAPSYCAATNMVVFDGTPEGNIVSDLYMVDATRGGALRQITNTAEILEHHPCISRDGNRIVYERVNTFSPSKDSEIWIKDLRTNENIQLGLGMTPTFSPDGRQIAFVKFTSDLKTTCLFTINSDGTNLTQLTDISMGYVWRPCYSPDGRRIVFQCIKNPKKDFDLFVLDTNGNNLIQLTINKSFDGEPYWADDNNIYFTSDRGGKDKHYQIWRFRMNTMYSTNTSYSEPRYQEPASRTVQQPVQQYEQPEPVRTVSVQNTVYHTVAEGETITDISRRYHITVKDVVKWNNLTTMTITPGMRLKVSAQ